MQAADEKGFTAKESSVRQMVFRAATAFSILFASLIFFLAIPVFPKELMILCAVGLGALAYKFPIPAVLLMLILTLPGYFYQIDSALPATTSLPVPLVAAMSVLLLGAGLVAGQAGATLGIAAGAGAAILMITPLQFLALPIIIATILFRTKGKFVLCACTLFTFAVLYFPLLAINSGAPRGGIAPIIEPVVLHAKLPIPILGLNEISSALGQIIGTVGSSGVRTYLANLADYWPISLGERLLPLGILFCLLAGAGIMAANRMLSLFGWLKRRNVNHNYIPYAAPALSLLAGVLVFYLLAEIFARPLDYTNTISISFLLIGTVLIGGSGSLVEIWLKRRDLILDIRDHLIKQTKAIRTQTDFLTDRTREIKSQCPRMDVSAEEALGQICEQELDFAEQTLTAMPLTDLELKAIRFQELYSDLNESINQSNTKLYQYYDEDRQWFNDRLRLAIEYGFDLGDPVQGPDFSQLAAMDYDAVLELQKNLNNSCENSTRLLAEGVKNLEEKLYTNVDSSFKRTGITIAAEYIAQERFAEAMQEFIVELGDIEHVLRDTLSGLDKEVLNVLSKVKTILVHILMPTAINLGDVNSVNYYQEVTDGIAKLSDPPLEDHKLPNMVNMVTRAVELSDIITALSSKVGDKIARLEKTIQSKTPRGYSWGVDPQIQDRMAEVAQAFRRTSSPITIHERISLLKGSPIAIETAAHALKDYSIAQELLINYNNMESFIEKTLRESGVVSCDNVPVKRQYAYKYLELYCLQHQREVLIEADTGRLIKMEETALNIKPKRINKITSRQ